MSIWHATVAVTYAVGLTCELAGVWFILRDSREARRTMTEWLRTNPGTGGDQITYGQLERIGRPVMTALRGRTVSRWSLMLLVAGIVLGYAGNFMTL